MGGEGGSLAGGAWSSRGDRKQAKCQLYTVTEITTRVCQRMETSNPRAGLVSGICLDRWSPSRFVRTNSFVQLLPHHSSTGETTTPEGLPSDQPALDFDLWAPFNPTLMMTISWSYQPYVFNTPNVEKFWAWLAYTLSSAHQVIFTSAMW